MGFPLAGAAVHGACEPRAGRAVRLWPPGYRANSGRLHRRNGVPGATIRAKAIPAVKKLLYWRTSLTRDPLLLPPHSHPPLNPAPHGPLPRR